MIGIDIGAYSIKAAVIKRTGKKVTVEQVACEILPPEKRGGTIDHDSLRIFVSKLIKKAGKGQSAVALSIPTSSAILKTIQVDASVGDEMLEGEMQIELVNFVPFPLDQVYADFKKIGRSEDEPDKNDIFVAASRRDIVDRVNDAVDVKAIKTRVVDVEAFAIGQIVEHLQGKGYKDAYAVVDIGYKTSTFCVFQKGDMIFSREQQVGGNNLTEAIAEQQGIELIDAEKIKHNSIGAVSKSVINNYLDTVSEQVALALEFFTSTNDIRIRMIYVTGGGSMVSGLIESLSENVPSCEFNILPIGSKDIKVGNKTNNMSLESVVATSAVAIGLSLRK